MAVKGQAPNPWISRDAHQKVVEQLSDRCADAEACLIAVLNLIDPDLLERHSHDWKAAAAELLE